MEIVEPLYHVIVDYIYLWGYWGVLLGMALESACMPVPSEIVLPFGGYLVSRGIMSFWEAVSAGLLGGVLGSVISYVVGYYGGRPLILKYGRYVLITQKDVARADRLFERYGTRIVFWARFLPIVRTFISLPAGVARMNFSRFLLYTVFGSLPWTIIFTYGGLKLGENWMAIRTLLERFDIAIAVVVILSLGLWLVTKIRAINRAR